jgi:hypothetical protein
MIWNAANLIQPKIPPFWRDNTVEMGLERESRQKSRHFGGIVFLSRNPDTNPTKVSGFA